jgi:predicted ribosomally synthesized peptide with SipW-like signal peptide
MAVATSTIIGAAGLALSAAGTVAAFSEQQKSNKLQARAIEVQRNQAEIEAGRARRQVYRDMLKAQAQSEASAAAQGGLASSALAGGLSQAANSGLQSGRDINQNLNSANQLFDLKKSSIGIGQTSSLLNNAGRGMSSLAGFLSGPRN